MKKIISCLAVIMFALTLTVVVADNANAAKIVKQHVITHYSSPYNDGTFAESDWYRWELKVKVIEYADGSTRSYIMSDRKVPFPYKGYNKHCYFK